MRGVVGCMVVTSVVLVVALTGGAGVAAATQAHPTVNEVSGLVMCPTCDTTLDRSDSPAAERMRVLVREHVKAGETRNQILHSLVREYGGDESILATPPRHGTGLIAWLPPALGGLVLVLVGGVTLVRWRRAGARRQSVPQGVTGSGAGDLPEP